MFNKGKIEELNIEITRLDSLVQGLSEFGAVGVLEIKDEISKLEKQKGEMSLELLNLGKEIAETKAELI